ncbi:hypothetical protein H312_00391 [Anncaliia algerae PRA339]|uniref:Uncharacterized protein n=1 Tax=Anncaliia algerae PRA339 TaxID=1288291 RepID=A0A059F5A1_9MICR|nr:hypothetical protein H312_00391 [Anncaliia algerae PRA339]
MPDIKLDTFRNKQEMCEVFKQKFHSCESFEEKSNLFVLFEFLRLLLAKKHGMELPLLDTRLDDKNFDEKIESFKMNNGGKAFNDIIMHDLSKFMTLGSKNSDWKTEFMKNAEIYLMKDDLENLFAIYHPNSLQDTHPENTNKASKSEKKEGTEDFGFFKSSCNSSSCNNFELSEDSNHISRSETSICKSSKDFCNQIPPKKLRRCTKNHRCCCEISDCCGFETDTNPSESESSCTEEQ